MFCTIVTTTNNKTVAKDLSKYILDKKISPCVQMYNITSSFMWDDNITSELEYKIEIKTIEANENKVIRAIEKFHNYDIPEIVKIPLDIKNESYKSWFLETINIKGD